MASKDRFFGSYWKIESKNSGKVMEVSNPNDLGSEVNIHQGDWLKRNNQKFLLIPVTQTKDGGLADNYYIIAKHSGCAVDVSIGEDIEGFLSSGFGLNVWQYKFDGSNFQTWHLTRLDEDNHYKISSQGYRGQDLCLGVSNRAWMTVKECKELRKKLIKPYNIGKGVSTGIVGLLGNAPSMVASFTSGAIESLMKDRTKAIRFLKKTQRIEKVTSNKALFKSDWSGDIDPKLSGANIDLQIWEDIDQQKWKIERAEEIALPSLSEKSATYVDMSKYLPEINSVRDVPKAFTDSILVSEDYLPFIYINDEELKPNQQAIESPYYKLRLDQFWKYTGESLEILPGEKLKKSWRIRQGMDKISKNTIEKVLNKKIVSDAKLDYVGIGSLDVTGEISSKTKSIWEDSTNFNAENEVTEERIYEFSQEVIIHQYQLIDRYSVFRLNKNPVASFEVQTNLIKRISYPKDYGTKVTESPNKNLM